MSVLLQMVESSEFVISFEQMTLERATDALFTLNDVKETFLCGNSPSWLNSSTPVDAYCTRIGFYTYLYMDKLFKYVSKELENRKKVYVTEVERLLKNRYVINLIFNRYGIALRKDGYFSKCKTNKNVDKKRTISKQIFSRVKTDVIRFIEYQLLNNHQLHIRVDAYGTDEKCATIIKWALAHNFITFTSFLEFEKTNQRYSRLSHMTDADELEMYITAFTKWWNDHIEPVVK